MTDFLPSVIFAEVAGITGQAVRKIIARTLADPSYLYRGSRLIIRRVKGRGGKSGVSYEVALDSCPAGLQLALNGSQNAFEVTYRTDSAALQESKWLSFHLAPIAALKPHSPERGQAVKDFAASQHLDWTGAPQTFSKRTVFRQLSRIEDGDARSLLPRQRQDAGQAKVIVTREFDTAALAASVARQQLEKVRAKLTRYIGSLIAGGASPKMARLNANAKLNGYAEELGMAAGGFTVPDYRFEEKAAYKNVHRHRTDAKAEADAKPRISRGLHGLWPCDAIICDVHPLDIQVRRADRSVATPRLTEANYAAARQAMQEFRGEGGRPLGVVPDTLIVPPSLEGAALDIVNSAAGAAGATNKWKGTAKLIVTPWVV